MLLIDHFDRDGCLSMCKMLSQELETLNFHTNYLRIVILTTL